MITKLKDPKALLKALLLNEGVTQKEAAAMLNISEKTVGRWIDDPKDGYRELLNKVRSGEANIKADKESVSESLAKIRVRLPTYYPVVKEAFDKLREPNLNSI